MRTDLKNNHSIFIPRLDVEEWDEKDDEKLPVITDKAISTVPEGKNVLYYGKFGSGKTYAATKDILDLLDKGYTVYATWKIQFDGYDQTDSFSHLFSGLIGKRRFYNFNHKNFHYVPLSEIDKVFPYTTDCYWFIDEGHLWLNSYVGTKLDIAKIASVLHTRHYSRTLCIITQRSTAVHVTLRANINIFYKCEKVISWPRPLFVRMEFQDMKEDTVDEESKPQSTKWYWGSKRVFAAYDSKYMRGDTPRSQPVYGYTYKLNFVYISGKILFKMLYPFYRLTRRLRPRRRSQEPFISKTRKPISEVIQR